jgi:hypothetical protein
VIAAVICPCAWDHAVGWMLIGAGVMSMVLWTWAVLTLRRERRAH